MGSAKAVVLAKANPVASPINAIFLICVSSNINEVAMIGRIELILGSRLTKQLINGKEGRHF